VVVAGDRGSGGKGVDNPLRLWIFPQTRFACERYRAARMVEAGPRADSSQIRPRKGVFTLKCRPRPCASEAHVT
jgi:hypothetical protein